MAQGADHNHDSGAPPRLRGPPPGAAEPPVYEVFHGDNQQTDNAQNPNDNPQTTTTTAPNANATPPTLKDTIQSIKADDFLNVHRIPCARQGFLTGIGAGAVVGMGRYMFGGESANPLPSPPISLSLGLAFTVSRPLPPKKGKTI